MDAEQRKSLTAIGELLKLNQRVHRASPSSRMTRLRMHSEVPTRFHGYPMPTHSHIPRVILVVAMLVLLGCGKKPDTTTPEPAPQPQPNPNQPSPGPTPDAKAKAEELVQVARDSKGPFAETYRPLVKQLVDAKQAGLAVPGLTKLLTDTEYLPRRPRAAEILGELGPAAVDAIPPLLAHVKDRKSNAREESIQALGKICTREQAAQPPATAEVVKALIPALPEGTDNVQGDKEVRLFVLEAFWRIGPAAEAAVPEVIPYLSHKQIRTRMYAIRALSAIGGPSVTPVIPTIQKMEKDDPDPSVRFFAKSALGRLQKK